MTAWDLGGTCPACKQVRKDMIRCPYCVGTGMLRYVGWATTPWTEIVPGLWVGAHEYQPDERLPTYCVRPQMLEGAGFDVVASLVDLGCEPPEHVEHLVLNLPDDVREGLVVDEIEQAYDMACQVAEHVKAGRKVLVRCHAGLNRSSLVAALAMLRMDHSPQQTIDLIREKRSKFCLFNQRFVEIIMAQEASQEITS